MLQAFYATLVISLNVISGGGGSNLYEPDDLPQFTESEVAARIFGSKIVVVSEQAMLNVIYTIKACMLIMYTRLTLGTHSQWQTRWLAVYVCMGWVASETAFFTTCIPFDGYWSVPPPSEQCATLERYSIVQGTFNISSDALMLFIPLPLIFRTTLPWRQKLVLLFVFSLGLFVIVAALLTKIFNLTAIWDPTYMLWYVREASVAVYVSNLPMIWPLLREWFPVLKLLNPVAAMRSSTARSGRGGSGPGTNGTGSGNGSRRRATVLGPRSCGFLSFVKSTFTKGNSNPGSNSSANGSTFPSGPGDSGGVFMVTSITSGNRRSEKGEQPARPDKAHKRFGSSVSVLKRGRRPSLGNAADQDLDLELGLTARDGGGAPTMPRPALGLKDTNNLGHSTKAGDGDSSSTEGILCTLSAESSKPDTPNTDSTSSGHSGAFLPPYELHDLRRIQVEHTIVINNEPVGGRTVVSNSSAPSSSAVNVDDPRTIMIGNQTEVTFRGGAGGVAGAETGEFPASSRGNNTGNVANVMGQGTGDVNGDVGSSTAAHANSNNDNNFDRPAANRTRSAGTQLRGINRR